MIRDEAYYRAVWGGFIQAGLAEALVAEVDGEAVAALIVFRFAGTAWYLYGMSRLAHREKMPNALLQWEAIRRARTAGCLTYDLWGAPDEFSESDPMWGVFRFKEGLGGRVRADDRRLGLPGKRLAVPAVHAYPASPAGYHAPAWPQAHFARRADGLTGWGIHLLLHGGFDYLKCSG